LCDMGITWIDAAKITDAAHTAPYLASRFDG
jgi:hypothetical protein